MNYRTLLVLFSVSAFVGCGPPEPSQDEAHGYSSSQLDLPAPADLDRDGVPDTEDCDPQSSALGERLLEDDLGAAAGAVEPPRGFSDGAWRHTGQRYEQRYVRDDGDLSLFTPRSNGDGLEISTSAAITRTGSFSFTERQVFVVVGARDAGDRSFSAYGCGVEVIDGYRKASIVKLSGDPEAIRTTAIKRERRDGLEEGEYFDVEVRAASGSLRCTIRQRESSTTIVATDIGDVAGYAGLFTRQAAAAFKDARICRVGPSSTPTSTTAETR